MALWEEWMEVGERGGQGEEDRCAGEQWLECKMKFKKDKLKK